MEKQTKKNENVYLKLFLIENPLLSEYDPIMGYLHNLDILSQRISWN